MSVIELIHLSKYYGHSRGIEDISLEVSQGDFFGFIGPNGSGKSTTIRILLNLIFPSSGTGKIFGMDIVSDSKKIRSRITPFLILTLYTLLLNLLFGSLGFFVSALMKRAKPVTFFCVGIVLVFYFLYSISRIPGTNGDFGYISPFKWVNVEVLSPLYSLEFIRVAGFLGITALLILASGFLYRRKDILT